MDNSNNSNEYKRVNISVSRMNEEDYKWLMEYAKKERLSFSAAIFKLARDKRLADSCKVNEGV